jgi:hypothetical protein
MDYRWMVVVLAACGDNTPGPVPEVEPGCHEVPWTSKDQFSRSSELGPVVGYTLRDFDASGRWFSQGLILDNMRLVRDVDGDYQIIDRGSLLEASDSDLFFTDYFEPRPDIDIHGEASRFTQRISNLREDGSLRYDQAFCRDKTCHVCTGALVRAERHDPQQSDKLTLVAELRPSEWWHSATYDVKVVGTTAYVVRADGLWMLDVADPTTPAIVGHHETGGDSVNDVALYAVAGARYAIIADTPVEIVDVTNPADPRLVAELPVEAHTVFTETRDGMTRAYFGGYDGKAPVYDVTNPASSIRLGAFDTRASYVHDVFVEDGIAYLNAWEKGFFVVDFRASGEPIKLGHWLSPCRRSHSSWVTTIGGRRIAVHGDETYDAHMTVVDVDPASPEFMQPLGTYQTREHVSVHNFTGVGTKAYFTHYQDGVRVVDVADPTNPVLVGYYNTWDPADLTQVDRFFASAIGLDLDVSRRLIFVADRERGLLILRDDT